MIFFNPLSPKSDQQKISPCNINALQNRVVMRIMDMISQDEFARYFINFPPLLLAGNEYGQPMRIQLLILGFKGLIVFCGHFV